MIIAPPNYPRFISRSKATEVHWDSRVLSSRISWGRLRVLRFGNLADVAKKGGLKANLENHQNQRYLIVFASEVLCQFLELLQLSLVGFALDPDGNSKEAQVARVIRTYPGCGQNSFVKSMDHMDWPCFAAGSAPSSTVSSKGRTLWTVPLSMFGLHENASLFIGKTFSSQVFLTASHLLCLLELWPTLSALQEAPTDATLRVNVGKRSRWAHWFASNGPTEYYCAFLGNVSTRPTNRCCQRDGFFKSCVSQRTWLVSQDTSDASWCSEARQTQRPCRFGRWQG